MDFSPYVILSDLDGTLFGGYTSAGTPQIPQRNLEAIRRFKEGGGIFTVATGRLHLNIRTAIPRPEALCNAPAVVCNGAYLYDFSTRQVLSPLPMRAADSVALLAFLRARFPALPFRVSAPTEQRFETLAGPLGDDAATYEPESIRLEAPAERWPTDDWLKVVLRGPHELLLQAKAELEAAFGDRLGFVFSTSEFLEASDRVATKGRGLAELINLLPGGTRRITVACGDYDNDCPMLAAADIAIAPKHSSKRAAAAADAVLCGCEDGLIADVIEGLESGRLLPREEKR